MRKLATILSGCRRLRALVMTPSSYEVDHALAEHLGVDAEVVLFVRNSSTASGMPPMPSCRQEPSSTRLAMCLPMASSTGPILGGCSSTTGAVLSTTMSRSLTWMNESPWVRGMLGLTRATTVLATVQAGLV